MSTHPDRQAQFLDLLKAHRGLLYKVTRLYGRSPADRDDLAQEVITHLWRSFPRYDLRLKFSTWMYRVALNVAISWRRRERTQTQHLVPEGEEVLENAGQLDAAVDEDDLALLYEAIGRFDELDRALLLLYLEGQPHQEIGEVLGMTPGNVATRLGRLKDRLRQAFRTAGHLAAPRQGDQP